MAVMRRNRRRSGLSLMLAGAAGVGFFWLTDPRLGYASQSATVDIMDAASQAAPGTFIGIAGSAIIAIIGLWLMIRRTA